ncbi:Transmembrane protein 60 [Holothuria leucospilota]|uniref:Transmembrane protein 60 n=1 Tax=Holothuria leucospilota TaxID=206669 RepID=A0A9Q0YE22_HOLLE|nr:Transmembrane protein 60 [Holothuria leucospilota]
MPLSYRIVCSCLLALFFFIMMAVKLDRKPDWNWFLVCLPLWIFNLFFSVLLIIRLVSHLRNGRERDTNAMSLFSKGLFIFVLLMKWIFEIMLCIKLQYVDGGGKKLSMFFVFIPLWILLLIAVVRLFPWTPEVMSLIKRNVRTSEVSSASRSTQSMKRGPTTSGLSNTVGAHPRSVGSRSSNSS